MSNALDDAASSKASRSASVRRIRKTFSRVSPGDSLRSKTPTALTNEALAKLLCHNVVVLVHEMHELGIASQFGTAGPDKPADDTPAIIRFPGA